MRRVGKAIPFKIDRNNQANLSTQLADGFRRAILTGYYRPGDQLPSFTEIALQLGVSIRTPREAMKRLVAENLVRSRSRIGCEVLDPSPQDPSGLEGLVRALDARCWRVATASGRGASFAPFLPPSKDRTTFRC